VYNTAGACNIAGAAAVQPDGKIVVGSTVGKGNASSTSRMQRR